ncbi:GNAT family N-acetyltransferase [Sciscionella sediminilitoris]|uniref:GNAT family N-acetyltransferase n=1 Tax=Sciscionella sediminilitoris TaxID=1445613 RepID=UPI000689CF6D|nr:GNAT family N-acetyltransferase [Sciscionella sp. SE31]
MLIVTPISIVAAEPDHAEPLTALMHASSAYRGGYAAILEGYQLTPEYLARNPTHLALSGQEILGFSSLIPEPPELDLLFVTDSAQGLGIGARLVTHLLDRAAQRGMTAVRVVSHPPAAAFYRRMGARQIGTVPPRPPRIDWPRPELVFDLPALSAG